MHNMFDQNLDRNICLYTRFYNSEPAQSEL